VFSSDFAVDMQDQVQVVGSAKHALCMICALLWHGWMCRMHALPHQYLQALLPLRQFCGLAYTCVQLSVACEQPALVRGLLVLTLFFRSREEKQRYGF
jgi:hypothetical protein